MSKQITVLLKWATVLVLIFSFDNIFAQTQNIQANEKEKTEISKKEAQNQSEAIQSQPSAEKFQVASKGEPQGNSFEAQIERAEFYKAQYAHDPATQAKYQQNIDKLKKELQEANNKAKE